MKQRRIYCDYNATTPVLDVIQKNYKQFLQQFGNASSLYLKGRQAKEALEQARFTVASFINATPDQVIFTSSGTEANNHVLQQLIVQQQQHSEPIHILVSAIEHSSILETVRFLTTYGIEVDYIPVKPTGVVDIDKYKALFKSNTKLVCVMVANNEIGVIEPIDHLVDIAHQHGALFHADGVQALGKIDVDVKKLNVDFLTCSSHKVYAPKGVGFLYIKNQADFVPLLYGGLHERGLRASTENIPGIMSLEMALNTIDISKYQAHTLALKQQFKQLLQQVDGITFNDPDGVDVLTNTVNVSFKGCDGQALAMNCDLAGIDVSTGSACSVGSIEPSHVLTAIGVSEQLNRSSLRFSFGLDHSADDIDYVARILIDIVDRLKDC
tara:strand:- start:12 stop:1157 length:1146 start_codon:yes stop_codon:yes gene_type:complete